MEKIYGMHKLVELQLFWSRTPTFSSGTPTFCQMGVLNSCFQNPSESSEDRSRRASASQTLNSEKHVFILILSYDLPYPIFYILINSSELVFISPSIFDLNFSLSSLASL